MDKRLRSSTALLIAVAAVAVVIGWWACRDTNSAVEARVVGDPATADSSDTTSTGIALTVAPDASAAAPKPTTPAGEEPDPTVASLRSRLTAPNVVPGEALLTFRSAEARERFRQEAAARGLDILDTIPQLNTARVRYERIEDLRDTLGANAGDHASVEGNLWLSIPGVSPPISHPNQDGGREPFGYSVLDAINAAGDRASWGKNVTVAVLDTGILSHPTFAEGQITRVDLVNDGQAFHSHGTSVASIIGGQHLQAPGVAPGARILDVRVAGADGYSVSSVLAQGIITAVDRGAQVINISLGGYGESAVLTEAVAYAANRGALVVAAAGNDGYRQLAIPAAYESVISVGSVDANSQPAYFSNAGAGLDLAAPGVGVVSAWETNKVALVSGTSQSSAFVSAAAAAYLSWGVAPSAVAVRLKVDARPALNASGSATGVGILVIKPPSRR
jgi:hypothetical protein